MAEILSFIQLKAKTPSPSAALPILFLWDSQCQVAHLAIITSFGSEFTVVVLMPFQMLNRV